MSASRKPFRVRFCEWQSFAIDLMAHEGEEAIALARALRESAGTAPFEEMDGGTEGWEAEAQHPCEPALPLLRKALGALNTAPRFRVGESDSYVIAAELGRLIRDIEGDEP